VSVANDTAPRMHSVEDEYQEQSIALSQQRNEVGVGGQKYILEHRVGLRSEGRINSTRRIFVEFSSDRIYIYIIRSSSNFFTDIRRIFDESHVILYFCMTVI
jgi:hypothetical protein